jgi:hypothetical protein
MFFACLGGEIGRRKGLKIPRLNGRAGSTPARGTIKNNKIENIYFYLKVFVSKVCQLPEHELE